MLNLYNNNNKDLLNLLQVINASPKNQIISVLNNEIKREKVDMAKKIDFNLYYLIIKILFYFFFMNKKHISINVIYLL